MIYLLRKIPTNAERVIKMKKIRYLNKLMLQYVIIKENVYMVGLMMFDATFNNISVISWRLVL